VNLCRSRAHRRETNAFMFTRTYSATKILSNEFHRVYEIKLTANSCMALCSSRNAVSFSSARATKRFLSQRWASAIQIVRPLASIAETQPQLHPALLRLSTMISQYFHAADSASFALYTAMTKVIRTGAITRAITFIIAASASLWESLFIGRRVAINSHRAGGGRNRPHPVTRHRNTGCCSERVAHFLRGLHDPL